MQGDPRVDDLMRPVNAAIRRRVKGSDAATDIYNRAYEAVMISMVVKTSTTGVKTPESIENTNPDYYKQEIARRDEIITRLKEAGENLIQLANFNNMKAVEYTDAWCALMDEFGNLPR